MSEIVIVPVKPFNAVSVMVDVPDEPTEIEAGEDALIVRCTSLRLTLGTGSLQSLFRCLPAGREYWGLGPTRSDPVRTGVLRPLLSCRADQVPLGPVSRCPSRRSRPGRR